MGDFIYELSSDTLLFKASPIGTFNDKIKDKCWFAFDKDKAESYTLYNCSAELHMCQTNRVLRLVNIISLKFKLDFWDKVNMLYNDNNTMDMRKVAVLLAIVQGLKNPLSYDIINFNV